MIDFIQNMDWSVLNFIQLHMVKPVFNGIMLFFTTIGNVGFIWIALMILFLISKKNRALGIMLAVGIIVEVVIGNAALKNIIARPRPCWIDGSVNMLIRIPSDYSFPSGHTFMSFISATIIARYNRKWGIFAFAAAIIISFSRLYLFVHFPSDVFAGIILGIICGNIIYFIFKKYTRFLERKE